jgi:hypothetical protein
MKLLLALIIAAVCATSLGAQQTAPITQPPRPIIAPLYAIRDALVATRPTEDQYNRWHDILDEINRLDKERVAQTAAAGQRLVEVSCNPDRRMSAKPVNYPVGVGTVRERSRKAIGEQVALLRTMSSDLDKRARERITKQLDAIERLTRQ